VDLLADSIAAPTRVWQRGLDFRVWRGRIEFWAQPLPEDADSLTTWAFRPSLDSAALWRLHGYVLGAYGASSPAYRRLLAALLRGQVQGGSSGSLGEALGALTDSPVAAGSETVEAVFLQGERWWIVTDSRAYSAASDATPVVGVGDRVRRGDPLVNAFEIHEFNRGQVPADLLGVTIPAELLGFPATGGLLFRNQSLPTTVTSQDGVTRWEFPVAGDPADVQRFWDEVHSRGLANPPTLARLLDRRENPVGEPAAANLPATVNPCQFLAAHYLRHHAFLVRLRPGAYGPEAQPGWLGHVVASLVPPHTRLIAWLELATPAEVGTMDAYAESPDLLPAGDLEEAGPTLSDAGFSATEEIVGCAV
jgi:hypothetical protein